VPRHYCCFESALGNRLFSSLNRRALNERLAA
jgi:hypothetical protein